MPKYVAQDLNPTLAAREPTPVEFAYLAGLMDGEGYFQGGRFRQFGIRISMSDPEAPEWLQATFGGKLYTRQTPTLPHLIWYVQRQADLRVLIVGMRPFLTVKGPRADAMLRLLNHLADQPRYEKLTRDCTRAERAVRRDARAAWSAKADELRAAIAASNFRRA